MKKLLTITLSFLCGTCFSASITYYISNSGNTSPNDGKSAGSPWPFSQLSSFAFSAGDHILLDRGETFYGAVTFSRFGTVGNPIVIDAYGTGADPIISGLTTVPSWTNLGSNIWESSAPISTLTSVNTVLVNGTNVGMGRIPNSSWNTYQSHSSNTAITSSSFNSATTNWTGAEVVFRSIQWTQERCPITSHSGTTLLFSAGSSSPGVDGNGCFIQNDARTLDATINPSVSIGSWYYNPSTKKIRMYNTVSPTNVQVSTIDETFFISSNFVTVSHIRFQGSNSYLFEVRNCKNLIIDNCSFYFAGKSAFYDPAPPVSSNEIYTISHCDFENNNVNAIAMYSFSALATINNNTVNNTGLIQGAGDYSTQTVPRNAIQYTGDGIIVVGTGSTCRNNIVTNTSHHGISTRSSDSITVKYNFISRYGMQRFDAGAIYSFNGDTTTVIKGRFFDHNIIDTGNLISNGLGSQKLSIFGIYLDGQSVNTHITNNSIANGINSGIHIYNAGKVTITDNTCFANGDQFSIYDDQANEPIKNLSIRRNKFISKLSNQFVLNHRDDRTNGFQLFSVADSNYYARPIDTNLIIQTTVLTTNTQRTLSGWKTFSGQDAHTKNSPVKITNLGDFKYIYNTGLSDSTFVLGAVYRDVANTIYNNTITLHSFESAVLIYDTATSYLPPNVDAGASQNITLPTNSATLTGSATDPNMGGSISTYSWVKISGGSATITSPSSAITTVTGLTNSTYVFNLTATNNFGVSASDTTGIIVNDSTVLPPVANAGPDQSITASSTTLDGSASTDPDGTIVSYAWTKISGPGTTTITTPSSIMPLVSNLQNGVYVFNLLVTNNGGATNTDTVQITVSLVPPPPPTPGSILIITHGKKIFAK